MEERAYELAHPDEHGRPQRRASRGSREVTRACCEMLGRKWRDPATGEAIEPSTCMEHIMTIAACDPNGYAFTFGGASPILSTNADGLRQWIEARAMVESRNAVAQRWLTHFGPPKPLSSLRKRRLTTSARTFLNAIQAGKVVMIVDAEGHRRDDPIGHRYRKGDVYDLAVTLVDPRTGSTVAVLFHECDRHGKLNPTQKRRASAAIGSRPDALCCSWGFGPEYEFAIKPSGRRKAEGSDGIDLKEVVLQVMPTCVRNAASATGPKRWSMSMDLWVPVMGVRRNAYHQALPDCVAECIVALALGRALARPVAEGGCM